MLVRDKILRKVALFIQDKKLVKSEDSVLIAVSGGKDSVVLCDILSKLEQKLKLHIYAFHLNHKMRGLESDGDAAFVENLCNKYGWKSFIREHRFTKSANFEAEARDIRYKMIHDIMSMHSIDIAATAHSSSDSVETVLMHIFNGTSLHGLTGIPHQNGAIIRPLLCLSTGEILAYIKDLGLEYREDSSNSSLAYERNYVRQTILPLLQKRYKIEEAILRLSENSSSSMRLLKQYVEDNCSISESHDSIQINITEKLYNKDLFCAVINEVFRDYFDEFPTQAILYEIERKFQTVKGNVLLYSKAEGYIFKVLRGEKHSIIFTKSNLFKEEMWSELVFETLLDLSCTLSLEGRRLVLRLEDDIDDKERQCLFVEKGAKLLIRQKRDGDSIKHKACTKKIKTIFSDHYLNPREKSLAIVVEISGKVAALLFVSAGAKIYVSDEFRQFDKRKKILAIDFIER